jgi:hypothetical protein
MIIDKAKAPKKFEPITITITIENEDELLDLLGRANTSFKQVKEDLRYFTLEKDFNSENVNDLKLFRYIKDLAQEANLIEKRDN